MESRKVNADLHNHLKTDSDMSTLSFNEVIDTARERLGEGGILGITNFNDERYEQFLELEGYERIDLGSGFYVPEKDILVVKGQEVPTKQGHLLVLGVPAGEHIKPYRDIEEIIEDAYDAGGITIPDHPFHLQGLGSYFEQKPEFCDCIDAVEVHNSEAELWIPGLMPRNANGKARKFYESVRDDSPKLGTVLSSDGHSLDEIGRSYTTLDMPSYDEIETGDGLVECLRLAIRSHRDYEGRMGSSRMAAFQHTTILVWYNLKEIYQKIADYITNITRKFFG